MSSILSGRRRALHQAGWSSPIVQEHSQRKRQQSPILALWFSLAMVSRIVPAETLALFFGNFFHDGKRLRAVILSNGGEQGIEQRDWRHVRSSKGSRLDRRDKNFVAFASQWREIRVCDADAIRAIRVRLL